MKVLGIVLIAATAFAQAPAGGRGGGRGGPPRPVLSVTTTAFPDGGEVPMANAGRGGNKSPEFVFHWSLGNDPTTAPDEGLARLSMDAHDRGAAQ